MIWQQEPTMTEVSAKRIPMWKYEPKQAKEKERENDKNNNRIGRNNDLSNYPFRESEK